MTPAETRAIVTVSLLAAFVDGEKHERERAEIKRIAEGLAQAEGVHLPTLYQDVLMKRVTLAGVLPALAGEAAAHAAAPFLATAVAPAFDQHHGGPLIRSA